MRKASDVAALVLGGVALSCWAVTFMAGTDVWHDAGRPDLLKLGATGFDLHVMAVAYYVLPAILSIQVCLLALVARRGPNKGKSGAA